MSGAKPDHNRIVQNLATELGYAFKQSGGCEAFSQAQRVRITQKHSFLYPDFVATCGGSHFDDLGNLLNPLIVFGVLSPSTAKRDRNEKREAYQSLSSLQEYVLIAQDTPRITLYRRIEGEK